MRRGQRRPDGTGGGRSGSPADADFASDGVIVGGAAACFAGALVENACSVIAPSSIAGLGAGHSAISDGRLPAPVLLLVARLEVMALQPIKSLRSKLHFPSGDSCRRAR